MLLKCMFLLLSNVLSNIRTYIASSYVYDIVYVLTIKMLLPAYAECNNSLANLRLWSA